MLQTNVPAPTVNLNLADLTKIYWTIRSRQDDCRKVTPEYSGYEKMQAICMELDVLNHKVAANIEALKKANGIS